MKDQKTLELRPEVAAFAQAMERKLRTNDYKSGWLTARPIWLLDKLQGELNELEDCVDGHATPSEICDEAADVANFAMMIADVLGGLK
jgi:NTP pyrophosphatase (non-canonical NTP hydrolase)